MIGESVHTYYIKESQLLKAKYSILIFSYVLPITQRLYTSEEQYKKASAINTVTTEIMDGFCYKRNYSQMKETITCYPHINSYMVVEKEMGHKGKVKRHIQSKRTKL